MRKGRKVNWLSGVVVIFLLLLVLIIQKKTVTAKTDWSVLHSSDLGFDSVYRASDDYVIGKKDEKVSIWNQDTKKLVVSCYDSILQMGKNNCVIIYKQVGEDLYEFATMNYESGLIDVLGEYSNLDYDYIIDTYQGQLIYATKKVEGKKNIGLIDEKGSVLIPVEQDEITYLGEKGEGVYYLKCGKKTDGEMLYALYDSKGVQLSEYIYKNIYNVIQMEDEDIGSEVLAEKENGDIGVLLDRKEIGFNDKLFEMKDGAFIYARRIFCGEKEYLVKCFCDSQKTYDDGEYLYDESSDSWTWAEHNLDVLSKNNENVLYEFYDLNGETVSKEEVVRLLEKTVKEHEALKSDVKQKAQQLDFDTLLGGENFSVEEISVKFNPYQYGNTNMVVVNLNLRICHEYTSEETDIYDRKAVAFYNSEGELVRYGLLVSGSVNDSVNGCILQCENNELRYFSGTKDEVVYTDSEKEYQYYDEMYGAADYNYYSNNIFVLKSTVSDNQWLLVDSDSDFVTECYGSDFGEIVDSGQYYSVGNWCLIEKKQDEYVVNIYDDEWQLMQSEKLTAFQSNFQMEYQYQKKDNTLKYCVVIYDDDSYRIVFSNGVVEDGKQSQPVVFSGEDERYGGIVYRSERQYIDESGWQYQEYVYDTDGELVVESLNQEKRSVAIFEKAKTIVVADSFWDGKGKVSSESNIPDGDQTVLEKPSSTSSIDSTTNDKGASNSAGNEITSESKSVVIPVKNTKLKHSSGDIYTVTKSGIKNGTVAYTKARNSKSSVVKIPATVKINGITYKVTSISAKAFKGNKKLKKVTIGKNVVKIGKQAFYGCKNLKNIIVKSTTLSSKMVGTNALKGINKKAVITVPKKKLLIYKKIFKSKGIGKKVKVK